MKKVKIDNFYIKEEKEKKKKESGKKINNLDVAFSLGLNLSVPIVLGVILGRYIDKRVDGKGEYTLILVIIGLIISLYNIYKIYKEVG